MPGPNTDCFFLDRISSYGKNGVFLSAPCPSLSGFFVLPFLSLSVGYFSPVIRHTDSSLSPSDTTKINFPALCRLGGPQSGLAPCSLGHTCTRPHKRTFCFIHPRSHWGVHRQAHIKYTQVQTHSYRWVTTSLFSNVLLVSSLQHPFVTAGRSWQQHLSILPLSSLCQPTLGFPSTQTTSPHVLGLCLSLSLWASEEQEEVRTVHKWLSYWCRAMSSGDAWLPCLCVPSQRGALGLRSQQLASHPWSVLWRRACDALVSRTQLRLASAGELLRNGVLVCVTCCHGLCVEEGLICASYDINHI